MSSKYRYELPERRGDNRQLGRLIGAACAVECAEIIERHQGPVVLITKDMQNALRLHDEIHQFTDCRLIFFPIGKHCRMTAFLPIRKSFPTACLHFTVCRR